MRFYGRHSGHSVRAALKALLLTAETGICLAFSGSMAFAIVKTNAYWSMYPSTEEVYITDAENVFKLDETQADYRQKVAIRLNDYTKLVYIKATQGSNYASDDAPNNERWWGIDVHKWSTLRLEASVNNEITGLGIKDYGMGVRCGSNAFLYAGQDNIINADYIAVYSDAHRYDYDNNDHISIDITAGRDNIITTASTTNVYNAWAIDLNNNVTMNLRSLGGDNKITGTTAAADKSGTGIWVDRGAQLYVSAESGRNIISAKNYGAMIDSAVLSLDAPNGGNEITAAELGLYASTGASIEVATRTGTNRIDSAQAVTSYGGGSTAITGQTVISGDIALLSNGETDASEASLVSLNYDGNSAVTGSIMAYNHSRTVIAPRADSSFGGRKIDISGDIIASFQDADASGGAAPQSDYVGGTVDLDLTDDSTFTGSAAAAANLAADRGTDREGTVNISMGNGSLWTLTGHSSVTSLSGNGGTVYFHDGGDALEIVSLTGSHNFALDLSYADHDRSDMIYIVNGTSAPQTITVKNLAVLDSEMSDGDAVRFARVADPQNEFVDGSVAAVVSSGIYNNNYIVAYRSVSTDPDSADQYDGDGTRKPASTDVEALYGGSSASNVYLYKNVVSSNDISSDDVPPTPPKSINDGAKTPGRMQDLMHRYVTDLDTFTKRQSQAGYFSTGVENDSWFRAGHKKFGVEDVGTISGNFYELGWGRILSGAPEHLHKTGIAAAWSRQTGHLDGYSSSLKFTDIYGALYDTHIYYDAVNAENLPQWKRDRFRYWDSYLKVHRAKNEYIIRDHSTDAEFDGDYHQSVVSLSTEYGAKLPLSRRVYWVPQAQLQLSWLGNYSYTDSQGLYTKADSSWSLVGRLGFDLVDVLDEKNDSRLYLKASLLHEFLDGADVTTESFGLYNYETGVYTVRGSQSGTWGTFGLGFSSRIEKDSYVFIDFEYAAGNDLDDTYTLTAGVSLQF
ncbi:MAG: autotransporter domain-containing protein [Pyramidobacter sp.]